MLSDVEAGFKGTRTGGDLFQTQGLWSLKHVYPSKTTLEIQNNLLYNIFFYHRQKKLKLIWILMNVGKMFYL